MEAVKTPTLPTPQCPYEMRDGALVCRGVEMLPKGSLTPAEMALVYECSVRGWKRGFNDGLDHFHDMLAGAKR